MKVGDIINYPVPGVCYGKAENTILKEAKILKIYDNIKCDDGGVIVDMELVKDKMKISGKIYN